MPLNSYGVLVGHAMGRRREGADTDTPHYQIHMTAGGQDFRIAVNVKSQSAPSELLYLLDDGFTHPATEDLAALSPGWAALPSAAGGASLDYIRGNLFDVGGMRPLPGELPGEHNDLADLLDLWILRAIDDPSALLYAFGERWGPEPDVPDKVFGFTPGNGVHDIHMNQGNSARFRGDDGVWQDGGLLLHFSGTPRWVALFLAFQSQSWHTDDTTGHALGEGPPASSSEAAVQIVAALVNPLGPAPEVESLTLLNASPTEVDLTGWRIADRQKNVCPLPAGLLDAGATARVPLAEPVHLGNSGGALTLLDAAGMKVHGVSYSADQARREGWTIVF
jgi:uncharacterized protein YukJ